ncbi:MAG: amidase [Phaeodactylibacter sp.]|uniref:amidase n=1 Tax=Phaeodactylibacter sp. TaxID=1940289 RepID=UPI0032EDE454
MIRIATHYCFGLLLLSALLPSCQPATASEPIKGNALNLEEITIPELQSKYEASALSAATVVQYYLDRIAAIDQSGPGLKSVLTVNPEALDIARGLDEERANSQVRGPLHGIPVLLKDNIDTGDQMPTTAGSRALAGSIAPDDATVVAKLREAGAIILGKTNLSEWANFRSTHSSSGWSGLGGQTHNPYQLDCNPCGSSSGSGVAVAANLCMLALGTETNGSIVCPSSANGIVGIKPTVGLLSRDGIIPISFTQDTPGPMARTVTDAAIALGMMTGVDETDAKTSASEGYFKTDYTPYLDSTALQGKRIGYYTAPKGTHYKVDTLMESAMQTLRARGAEVIEIEDRLPRETGSLSYQVMLYEFKDGLNQYFASLGADAPVKNIEDLIAFNKADEVELRHFHQDILEQAAKMGPLETDDYRSTVSEMQRLARAEGIDKIMAKYELDALIAPTGAPAWKTDHVNGDHYTLGSSSPAAWAGYPNISVPMGFIEGLPVGLSFYGSAWSEPVLIGLAYDFEQARGARGAPEL